MNAKKNILVLTDWFLPGYLAGGPIQSINNLTSQLSNDFNFKIITTDRDFKSKLPYTNIEINQWTNFDGREVFYISQENLNKEFIINLINTTPHNSIYLNSLFSKYFTVDILLSKHKIKSNIILAPRGMLGIGALSIKPLKKRLFLTYAKWVGLFKNIVWQATSLQETQEIKKQIGNKVIIHQISNLPKATASNNAIIKQESELKLCFIARILSIKNLNYAIDVLKNITQHHIIFDVYGPKEDQDYWNTCLQNANSLPKNITFNYKGILNPNQIGETISKYHALFLPTKNENYGHIIVETLQQGRLVVLSNKTPWRNLEIEQVGFDIDLSDAIQFAKAIESLCVLNQTEYNQYSINCVNYIQKQLNSTFIKQEYIKLFNSFS